jgi:hypothetical protein
MEHDNVVYQLGLYKTVIAVTIAVLNSKPYLDEANKQLIITLLSLPEEMSCGGTQTTTAQTGAASLISQPSVSTDWQSQLTKQPAGAMQPLPEPPL